MLIEALVPEAAVKALDEGVLDGLARFDKPQSHACPFGPLEHGTACSFGTVVQDDFFGETSQQSQIIQIPRHTGTRDRDIDDLTRADFAVVVDDVQNPEATIVGQLVVNEVEAPASHGAGGDLSGDPVSAR